MTSRSTWSSTPLALCALALGCGGGGGGADTGLENLSLSAVGPTEVVPGSVLQVQGGGFTGPEWGASVLRFEGLYDDGGGSVDVDVQVEAHFVDFDEMCVPVDEVFRSAFPSASGAFSGNVTLEVTSAVDGKTYRSESVNLDLAVADSLTPGLTEVASGDLIYVNDAIVVSGGGILFGEYSAKDGILGRGCPPTLSEESQSVFDEGRTVAIVEGCFRSGGAGDCVPISATDVEVTPVTPGDRSSGTFPFVPEIAGIQAGEFEGTVRLRNEHFEGPMIDSDGIDVAYELVPPALFTVSPDKASLGQYVFIEGGGFIFPDDLGFTQLIIAGSFTPSGGGEPVDLPAGGIGLIPQVQDGRVLRYVLSEDDALGELIDLRRITGQFDGQAWVEIHYDGDVVESDPVPLQFELGGVRQIVWLQFSPNYVDTLRAFGLRALDQRIRNRVVAVVTRDYRTINLEVRLEKPTDFDAGSYSRVEIHGKDVNGIGLLGYDNSPGKDTGNLRLADVIGGVNAITQEDGYPGYGGVFIQSLFAFSKHPGSLADSVAVADEAFDDVFDPFRPDRDGKPVSSADSPGNVEDLTSGDSCPADDRQGQIACAVWVLGNLIGTTLSHEIGHSLGLANPFGEGFHNSSDDLNRLMDSGGDRPFTERAELFGEGPGHFCTSAYDYLRQILPTDEPDDDEGRSSCF